MLMMKEWIGDLAAAASPREVAQDHAAEVAVNGSDCRRASSGGQWIGDQDEDWQLVEAGGEPSTMPPDSGAHGIADLEWQLDGEDVLFLSPLAEVFLCDRNVADKGAAVAVTNYRIAVRVRGGEWIHVPLSALSGSAMTDDGYLLITGRDCRDFRLRLQAGHDSWCDCPIRLCPHTCPSLPPLHLAACMRLERPGSSISSLVCSHSCHPLP